MEYWEPTQRVLQGDPPMVRRPKLTDTLLRKPPFRFLHDVISEICRQTGFGKGLFNEDELISTNIKDKESKVAYLSKIINCVGITLETNVPVRPLKIVAGLEPEQTNVFLQMLAAATIVNKEKGENAVIRVLAGEKQPSKTQTGLEWIQFLKDFMIGDIEGINPSKELSRPQEMTNPHTVKDVIDIENTTIKCDKELLPLSQEVMQSSSSIVSHSFIKGSIEQVCDDLQPSKIQPQESSIVDPTKPLSLIKLPQHFERELSSIVQLTPKMTENPEIEPSPVTINIQRTNSKESTPKRTRQSKTITSMVTGSGYKKQESLRKTNDDPDLSLPSSQTFIEEGWLNIVEASSCTPVSLEGHSLKNEAILIEDKIFDATTPRKGIPMVRPTSALMRPQSARKAPPILRNNIDKIGAKDVQESCMERPSSKNFMRMDGDGIQAYRKPNILQDSELKEDEEENMPILLAPESVHEIETPILSSMEDAGKLVRDILESKINRHEQVHSIEKSEETGIILGQIRGASFKKEDVQTKQEEIQKLRVAIQTICHIANPLGNSIDHLQEDIEIMNREYQFWITERNTYNIQLNKEKRITEENLQAESGREFEFDEQIQQQRQCINSLKAQILRNDEIIMKTLRIVSSTSTRWISLPSNRLESQLAKASPQIL